MESIPWIWCLRFWSPFQNLSFRGWFCFFFLFYFCLQDHKVSFDLCSIKLCIRVLLVVHWAAPAARACPWPLCRRGKQLFHFSPPSHHIRNIHAKLLGLVPLPRPDPRAECVQGCSMPCVRLGEYEVLICFIRNHVWGTPNDPLVVSVF